MRAAADARDLPLFINARTDLFLKEMDKSQHAGLIGEAIKRAKAYAEAGASGFFAPLLTDPALIKELADAAALPLNIMSLPGGPSRDEMAGAGAARISHGPFPYRQAMKDLGERFKAL